MTFLETFPSISWEVGLEMLLWSASLNSLVCRVYILIVSKYNNFVFFLHLIRVINPHKRVFYNMVKLTKDVISPTY